jgi:GTP-binding protein
LVYFYWSKMLRTLLKFGKRDVPFDNAKLQPKLSPEFPQSTTHQEELLSSNQAKIDSLLGKNKEMTNWIFNSPSRFVTSCNSIGEIPESIPEVAFCGRSNVGKSSLVNCILGAKKRLVRTSKTPGQTRLLNYFTMNEHLYLVDMPGYGFAKAPASLIVNWNQLLEEYIKKRRTLAMVYVLVDSRRGELRSSDIEFVNVVRSSQKQYTIVLTKIDKISDEKLKETCYRIWNQLDDKPLILASSSRDKSGLVVLKTCIAEATNLFASKKFEFEAQTHIPYSPPPKVFSPKVKETAQMKKTNTRILAENLAKKRQFVFQSKIFAKPKRTKTQEAAYKRIKVYRVKK